MSQREILAAWLGGFFGFCWAVLCMLMLISEGTIMDTLPGINWFACWICIAIGIVVGMWLSSLFGRESPGDRSES